MKRHLAIVAAVLAAHAAATPQPASSGRALDEPSGVQDCRAIAKVPRVECSKVAQRCIDAPAPASCNDAFSVQFRLAKVRCRGGDVCAEAYACLHREQDDYVKRATGAAWDPADLDGILARCGLDDVGAAENVASHAKRPLVSPCVCAEFHADDQECAAAIKCSDAACVEAALDKPLAAACGSEAATGCPSTYPRCIAKVAEQGASVLGLDDALQRCYDEEAHVVGTAPNPPSPPSAEGNGEDQHAALRSGPEPPKPLQGGSSPPGAPQGPRDAGRLPTYRDYVEACPGCKNYWEFCAAVDLNLKECVDLAKECPRSSLAPQCSDEAFRERFLRPRARVACQTANLDGCATSVATCIENKFDERDKSVQDPAKEARKSASQCLAEIQQRQAGGVSSASEVDGANSKPTTNENQNPSTQQQGHDTHDQTADPTSPVVNRDHHDEEARDQTRADQK